jgi:hypothetical protein
MASRLPVMPQVADAPPRVEEFYRAARQTWVEQRVAVGAVDFHGDVPEQEVDVVWTDGDLTLEVRSEAGEPLLIRTDCREVALVGGSLPVSDAQVEAHRSPVGGGVLAGGLVRSGSESPSLHGRQALHADAVGFGSTTHGESEFSQAPGDDSTVDADFPRHLEDALALGMAATDIVSVDYEFAVHDVYNLHTSGNHYSANGIAVHNCRCVVRPVMGEEMAAQTTFALDEDEIDDTPLDDAPEVESEDDFLYEAVPVHGVLAPLNVMSGDRRMLTGDISIMENIPVPLRWVKADVGQHEGAVRVGTIRETWEQDGEIRWRGTMLNTVEADEVMNLMAEGKMGISVDMDAATFEIIDESGNPFDFEAFEPGDPEPIQAVSSGRVRAATLVDIAAFPEAWAALGDFEEPEPVLAAGCVPCVARELDGYYGDYIDFAISEQPWDGSASRFNIDQWRRSTLIDTGEGDEDSKSRYRLPVREPNGDLNRAGVHAAAARINQVDASDSAIAAGRRKLIAAYRALDEEPPESLTASAFAPGTKDAPGWITHPKETARIRRYWTKGAGAAKIRWGVPGDFNRCRSQLRKYVRNPKWLAGTCANMHKEALGFWPGQERMRVTEGAITASAFTLVEETATLPHEWFEDPALPFPTPVTVTKEGRVFGHIALWGTCHIGYGLSVKQGNDCVAPPESKSGYAYFLTGVADTDQGEVNVGVLTMGTGHAPERMRAIPAAAHYDNTGTAVADVAVGEDEHGIWFSGAMRSGMTDEQVRAFKASSLSGDWRTIKSDYEMVAALVVNVPGFPIPRRSMGASGGRQVSLVAAGVVNRETPVLETFDMGAIVDEVERRLERKARRQRAQAAVRAFRIDAARARLK